MSTLCLPSILVQKSKLVANCDHCLNQISDMQATSYLCKNLRYISKREKQILELLSNGQSSVEIASLLYLSSHTVNDHRKSLKEKLGARNVAEMIRKGFELQLLNPTI